MQPRLAPIFAILVALVSTQAACAQSAEAPSTRIQLAAADNDQAADQSVGDPDDFPAIRARIEELIPGVVLTSIGPTPIEGLFEVAAGAEIVYMTADGKYFIQSDIYDLDTRTSITEQRRGVARMQYIKDLDGGSAVTFAAADEKYRVFVFTDVDCGYCRKLHREIGAYNDRGITVQYLSFPRSGPGTDSWAKADAVWCSTSQQAALTAAKNGEEVDAPECETPVAEHYALGKQLGIAGTPAIFTEQGELIVGYRSADELEQILADEG